LLDPQVWFINEGESWKKCQKTSWINESSLSQGSEA